MKRILLSVVTMFAVVSIANAQGFHLGAKAGANLGKIDGTSFKDEFNLGYQLGGFAEIDFTKGFGIQPEVLFSQTNTTVTDEPLSGLKGGEKINLNYISVPVLLRLNASKLLTFHVGPQFSILTNNHKTTAGNVVDAFKGGDFAMVAGAQVNLGMLKVYGRYNIGLSDIKDVSDQGNWKSQQIQFGVGIKIL
ncbi:PorT family protein [Panacibacter ginsenosidivorans]|uniref:PorT family protein n=1 Tax=Panacibacter ginsenosidivorans TaxID=1813871 RepID=A0A5B8VEB3_9BACT|nr:porin family protein [Panacibacter ginsenosidivorans]QEC69662.1 PorT family protein [Panacibacter ginsenosidivorans]